jgi:FMN phosphatase YigB (HAD superfamily)
MLGQLRHVGLADHLDSVTFSGQIGWCKPSQRIFQAATAALGAPPEATVMVGDSVSDDVEGARAAGMRAVLLRRPGTDLGPPLGPSVESIGQLSAIALLLFGTAAI